jgi:hypothetical protein
LELEGKKPYHDNMLPFSLVFDLMSRRWRCIRVRGSGVTAAEDMILVQERGCSAGRTWSVRMTSCPLLERTLNSVKSRDCSALFGPRGVRRGKEIGIAFLCHWKIDCWILPRNTN